jgi:hypothetical protein
MAREIKKVVRNGPVSFSFPEKYRIKKMPRHMNARDNRRI